ncbi:MAG: ribosomal-protein-serine acetyltransferase [Fibrobacteres bacterium]|nr:ribosomal-protein-serine acetyltransferase [Fibrobacterota bacterium]
MRAETMYETERMIIRRFLGKDLIDAHEILSDPEVAKYEFWDPYDLEDTRQDLEIQGAVIPGTCGVWNEFAVELKDGNGQAGSDQVGGKVIGNISFKMNDEIQRQAEIGFHFNRRFHGKGYGKEAVIGLIDYLWKLGAYRIWAVADTRNESSWRMMEKLGMRREGHMVHNCLVKGEWADEYLYALLEKEWRALRVSPSLAARESRTP